MKRAENMKEWEETRKNNGKRRICRGTKPGQNDEYRPPINSIVLSFFFNFWQFSCDRRKNKGEKNGERVHDFFNTLDGVGESL